MLRIRRINNRAAPIAICDHCGRLIDDSATAWYEWLESGPGPVTGEIYFLHKACVDAFEAARPEGPGQMWANGELTVFPYYLGGNLRVDWDAARELADFSSRL